MKLLHLAQRAHEPFENQPAREKRKLLDFVLSNCTWKDGRLAAEYRKPFDVLAADQRIPAGIPKKTENWLPTLDTFRTFVSADKTT